MTSQQFSHSRGRLVWNLVQWLQRRQAAKRQGNQFSVEYCQQWIEDCRARVGRLNALQRKQVVA